MTFILNEMLPEDCESVDAFLHLIDARDEQDHALSVASADDLSAKIRQHPSLSLIARMDGEIVGIAYCVRNHDAFSLKLALHKDHRQGDLARELAGRALAKLIAKGVYHCDMRIGHAADATTFWQLVSWDDNEDYTPLGTAINRQGGSGLTQGSIISRHMDTPADPADASADPLEQPDTQAA